MRTVIIIVIGFVVWAACLGIAKLTSSAGSGATTIATVVFAVIWFVAAGVNMWIGVSQAGYSFAEELPIFLVIFLVPVVVAVFVNWKWL